MNRGYVAVAGIVAIFLVIQLGALALVAPFQAAGYQAVENPSDPTNSLLYLVAILVVTGLMLLGFKLDADRVIRAMVVLAAGFVSYYVFTVLLPPIPVEGVGLLPVAAAGGLSLALWVYPEWYIIDASGIVMGMGAAALFGISFGPLPALVLLIVLAVYDAVSVYGTEHMLTLASGVMRLKIPVLLVVPLTLTYSFRDEAASEAEGVGSDASPDAEGVSDGVGGQEPDVAGSRDDDAPESDDEHDDVDGVLADRDAFFIGLGDAVMPTVLVASAAFFIGGPDLGVPGVAATLPAVTAIIGTMVGLLVLMRLVMAGRAHAGLPLLNGGAIAGYLVGAIAAGIPLVEALGLGPYV